MDVNLEQVVKIILILCKGEYRINLNCDTKGLCDMRFYTDQCHGQHTKDMEETPITLGGKRERYSKDYSDLKLLRRYMKAQHEFTLLFALDHQSPQVRRGRRICSSNWRVTKHGQMSPTSLSSPRTALKGSWSRTIANMFLSLVKSSTETSIGW